MTLWASLHVSEEEWNRVGWNRVWETGESVGDFESRHLDIWASREWDSDGDPVETPFDEPYMEQTLTKTSQGLQRGGMMDLTVGEIGAVECLDELRYEPVAREHPTIEPPPSMQTLSWDDVEPIPPADDVLEAVYVINKHAKRLADEAASAYERGFGAEARANSVQKKALYGVKTAVLHGITKAAPESVEAERHELSGDQFVCLYVNGWSFHQPDEDVCDELSEVVEWRDSEGEQTTVDYTRDSTVEHSEYSLKEALTVLDEQGVCANNHLDQTHVSDGWSEMYVGWKHLE